MKNEPPSTDGGAPRTPTHEEIATLAYQYYIDNGSRPGNAMEDWLRAEQSLRNRILANRGGTEAARSPAEQSQEATLPASPGIAGFEEQQYPLPRGKRTSGSREEMRSRPVGTPQRPSMRSQESSQPSV